ncbi:MAG: DNA-binding protein [Gordonia sp. (in: high G+C Gram-positive bacteria)]|nr:MAG: DNA-binding protein [Gordonia sp. (in: high G+C Gram-positive bacteria)]
MADDNEIDPKDNPEYLTLSAAGRECGVRVPVLQMLIQERLLTTGITRTRNGHAYIHRDHVPSWQHIEQRLVAMYADRLHRADRALAGLETEVEALRNDLTEAQEHPYQPLGDDLHTLAYNPYDHHSTRTARGALTKLASAVGDLGDVLRHLEDVRRTV